MFSKIIFRSAVLVAASAPALAGPPFMTDDPEPVEFGHWEVNYAASMTHHQRDVSGLLPNIDINYGAAPGLQLHLQPQAAYDHADTGPRYGMADWEAGVKYRLLDEDDDTPMVSLYPLVELPTGAKSQGLGTGTTREFLPLWVQKSIGDWTVFGGGGYWLNSGSALKNSWYTGWAALYQITPDLQLGAEIFSQSADPADGKTSAGFNLGAIYVIAEDYHLLVSGGRGLVDRTATNEGSVYAALQVIY